MSAITLLDGIKATTNSEFERIAEAHSKRRVAIRENADARLLKMNKAVEFLRLKREAEFGSPVAMGRLREAVSSGDFPLLFQSISQASMLGQYAELPQQWPTFSVRTTVPDFRPARMVRWDTVGGQSQADRKSAVEGTRDVRG